MAENVVLEEGEAALEHLAFESATGTVAVVVNEVPCHLDQQDH